MALLYIRILLVSDSYLMPAKQKGGAEMPVISFANPNGGAGKTTFALILATQLSENGASETIIDADPERWISQ